MDLEEKLTEIFPHMVLWRRHLHQHPELSYHEQRTASYIAEILTGMGINVESGIGGHGLTALIKGAKPGPTVALRADIDALPIQDEKTCEYASRIPGVMHACGHDAHTAALLGIAKILMDMSEQLPGNVRLIFQPAEEISPGGAVPMINDGVLNGVDVIYGVHLWSPFPVGAVYSRVGPMMAAPDEFTIEIRGKGGHGGLPHDTIDSVTIGAHLVVNLQTIVSRNIDPTEQAVVSVGSIHSGTSFNVIAERCVLSGTVRTFNPIIQEQIKQRIEQIAQHTCDMFGAECVVDYKYGYPTVVNNEAETERFFRVSQEIFGTEQTKECPLIMAGEDFSYYLQRIPGCFIFVGAGNEAAGVTAPHHHPRFDIDEAAMRNSVKILLGLTLDYLKSTIL